MTSKLLSLPSVAHGVLVIVNVIHLHDFRYESIDKEGKTSNTKSIEYYVTCYVHCQRVESYSLQQMMIMMKEEPNSYILLLLLPVAHSL